MSSKPLDPVQTRKAILTVGATILLIGVLAEPAILSLFTTQFGVLRIILALVTGAVFAIGVSQVGEMALRSPIEPWYARPGAPLLITIVCGVFVIGWALPPGQLRGPLQTHPVPGFDGDWHVPRSSANVSEQLACSRAR